MKKEMKLFGVLMLVAVIMCFTGCGPTRTQIVRYDIKPYSEKELKQTKGNVTIEDIQVKEFPAYFTIVVPLRDEYGKIERRTDGSIYPRQIRLFTFGQLWWQLKIKNNTNHIMRLDDRIVVKLIDPSGEKWNPLMRDDIAGAVTLATGAQLNEFYGNLKQIQLLNESYNATILPDDAYTCWLAFKPVERVSTIEQNLSADSGMLAGLWQLILYEFPVQFDEAGKVTKRTSFGFKTVVKKFIDTYEQKDFFSSKVLIGSEEAK